ncbi:MATE family efflux transporter [Pseudoprimorskyibacter insulae]|uniref:DNA damage-inducible protein F n=1 Tax=Pseudoprimorskyibacter insulae TaxID=1695997 RepID=A0A2R8APE0_9RHOB|nr:MATE family efflux transporter [Pseudoprimorskyibacter insulae]SPF77911.1 DNA damage-inducible protein F [Pseudoprimorskyibacter insulae]
MTKAITHRRVLTIAAPIVLSNATVPILGAVDTGVVGQLGEAAPIGAVGIGAIILTSIYWIYGFLRMGTAGLTAQAAGRGDDPEVVAILTRVLLIGGIGGLIYILLQVPIFAGAFLISPATPEVEALARDYMSIRIWTAPAAIALYGITGWLIALERTRAVLAIQITMNLLNIGLDLLFVLGLGWGVEGVAIATAIAELTGLAMGLYLCREAFSVPDWRNWARVLDRARLITMARVNTDILIRSLLLQAMFVSFLFLAADFGDVTLASNQVLMQFLSITAYAMDGFAFAAEALVGRSFGAGAVPALRRTVKLTGIWSLTTGALMAITFALIGPALIDIMADVPEVQAEARHYLPYMIAAPIIGAAPWMLDGIFIGATRSADMRNMMAISTVIYVIALLILLPAFGNHGLWAALLISFAVRGVTLGLRYPALERAAAKNAPAFSD